MPERLARVSERPFTPVEPVVELPDVVALVESVVPALLDAADLVTEMREVKHYYTQGVLSRDGIDR